MLGTLLALLLSLLPTTDEGNVAAAATLPDREECDDELAFQAYDCPERARWALLTISNRESPYSWSPNRRWVGQHTAGGDNLHSARIGRMARKLDRYSWWCPSHWGDEGHSTAGPHGLMVGYNVQRLDAPGNCVPWWIFATARVSATAALDRYVELCATEPAPGERSWCPRLDRVVATRERWDARARRAKRRI